MKFILQLRLLFFVMALICAPQRWAESAEFGSLNLDLPDMGDSSGIVLGPEEERRLGEAFMREIRQQIKVVDDPEINEYINSLGYRLASNSDNQEQNFTFFVVDDPAINAFAVPGGFIGVNTGLIAASESENELASVLAHEIAHITQRHIARSFEKADRLNLPALAALLAAIALGSQNGELGQAALAATQAGAAQAQINFTRGNEEEADRVGMQTLARAGFDPRSMPVFFERLQQSARFAGPRPPEFLSTHPVTASRVSDSRNRAEQYPYRQVGDSLSYHLLQARLDVMAEKNPRQGAKRFAEALKNGQHRNREGARYGYALTLLQAGDYAAARAQTTELLSQDKNNISYQILLAKIEMASGHSAAALKIYADALRLYPGNHPLTLLYGRGLLQNGQAAKASELLRTHLRRRTPEPALYKLLAEATGEAGFKAEAHRNLAEYYYLNGIIDAAITQLTIALRLKDTDFYQSSQIEARLKQFETEALEARRNR